MAKLTTWIKNTESGEVRQIEVINAFPVTTGDWQFCSKQEWLDYLHESEPSAFRAYIEQLFEDAESGNA